MSENKAVAEAGTETLIEWLKRDAAHLATLKENIYFISGCSIMKGHDIEKKTRFISLLTQLHQEKIDVPYASEMMKIGEELKEECEDRTEADNRAENMRWDDLEDAVSSYLRKARKAGVKPSAQSATKKAEEEPAKDQGAHKAAERQASVEAQPAKTPETSKPTEPKSSSASSRSQPPSAPAAHSNPANPLSMFGIPDDPFSAAGFQSPPGFPSMPSMSMPSMSMPSMSMPSMSMPSMSMPSMSMSPGSFPGFSFGPAMSQMSQLHQQMSQMEAPYLSPEASKTAQINFEIEQLEKKLEEYKPLPELTKEEFSEQVPGRPELPAESEETFDIDWAQKHGLVDPITGSILEEPVELSTGVVVSRTVAEDLSKNFPPLDPYHRLFNPTRTRPAIIAKEQLAAFHKKQDAQKERRLKRRMQFDKAMQDYDKKVTEKYKKYISDLPFENRRRDYQRHQISAQLDAKRKQATQMN